MDTVSQVLTACVPVSFPGRVSAEPVAEVPSWAAAWALVLAPAAAAWELVLAPAAAAVWALVLVPAAAAVWEHWCWAAGSERNSPIAGPGVPGSYRAAAAVSP